jgi:uncharacterized protein (TIGR03083 family)
VNTDEVWAEIDAQRAGLADVLEPLTPEQWTSASLCEGWRVRDVAAHLTHSHMAPGKAMIEAIKSGFRFDPMIRRLGIEDSRSQAQIVAALRVMVGSRRKVPMTSDRDPLMDILVHTQDITVPLGIDRPMPTDAAVEVAHHLWRMRFPMQPARRLHGVRLIATDADFAVGEGTGDGTVVREPIRDVVMILAGRAQP